MEIRIADIFRLKLKENINFLKNLAFDFSYKNPIQITRIKKNDVKSNVSKNKNP